MKKYLYIIILIAAIYAPAQSQFAPSRYFRPGQFTEFVKNDTSISVNVDTLDLWVAMRRTIDSLIAIRAVDYLLIRYYGVIPNNVSDSVNLQIGTNGVYEGYLPNFNMKAYNFSLLSTTPHSLVSAFRTDLPPLAGADSMFIVRGSRNDAMNPKCAITIYKVIKSAGPDQNDKTTGVFYDMVRFSDAILPTGANRFFTLDLCMRRQP